MAIAKALTNTSLDSGTGGNITVTKPTGSDGTHILILCIGAGAVVGVGSYDTPTGWTKIGQVLDANAGSAHITGQVYWSLGDNTNLTFTASGSIATKGYICVAFTGCDLTTPIDATGTANSNTGAASLTTNAVTIATDQAWHLIGFFDWLGRTFTATSFTVAVNGEVNESAALLYNTTPLGTGSTGTVAVTASGTGTGQVLIGVPFALRPAAAAASAFPLLVDYGSEPATIVWDWAGAY